MRGFIVRVAVGFVLSPLVQAQDLKSFLLKSTVSGDIRSYYFTRYYTSPSQVNQAAYSLGGALSVRTPTAEGVSAGVTFYTANALGLNDLSSPAHLVAPLMGTTNALNTLGQAYLKYANNWFTVKAGNQLLDNPWMNSQDAFMIPNAFQGVTAAVYPNHHWIFQALRIFRYKHRRDPDFSQTDLVPTIPQNVMLDGALAVAARYQAHRVAASTWFYRFYNVANMFYDTVQLRMRIKRVTPYTDFQYVRQIGAGLQYNGHMNATAYGSEMGVREQHNRAFLAYDEIVTHVDTVNGQMLYNGGLVTPYAQSSPLYTSNLSYGPVNSSAPGQSWMVAFVVHPTIRWRVSYAWGYYRSAPYAGNVTANYLSITYFPRGWIKGLSVRNRLSVNHGTPLAVSNDYFPSGTFYDERFMMQYSF